ncbi:MAG: radical SAM protein [bacterium]|nr:radical SAM protein [bacterium]
MEGKKFQIHTTFVCNKGCGFCPVPLNKMGLDIVRIDSEEINPLLLDSLLDRIIPEKKKMLGAALSGGEPTLFLDRVVKIIKRLKLEYGSNFHIHLYTNGSKLIDQTVKELVATGLDELRVNSLNPIAFQALVGSPFDVVCEVPCIPSEGYLNALMRLIDKFPRLGVKHLNLNEAEVTQENVPFFNKLGLPFENSRILGSHSAAQRIMEYCAKVGGVEVFFCTYEIAERIRIERNRLQRKDG